MNILNILSEKNADYSIVWLAHLYDNDKSFEFFLSSTENYFFYNSKTYKAETFSYKSNPSKNGFDGGGTFEIATVDNKIIELVESKKNVNLEVLEILVNSTEKKQIEKHYHKFGKPSIERGKASFQFDADDRADMTFPSLVFSAQNNRGNS